MICSLVRLYTWHDKSRVSDAQKIALILSIIVCSDYSSNARFNLLYELIIEPCIWLQEQKTVLIMIYFGKNMAFISEKKTKYHTPVEDPFDVSSDLLLQAADAKSGAVTVAS